MNKKQIQMQKVLRTEQLGLAIRLLSVGQHERARLILKELICSQPDNVVAWLWLSESYPANSIRRGRLLELALDTNPGNPVLLDAMMKAQIYPEPVSQPQRFIQNVVEEPVAAATG